ncbi:MAG: hypothetical protein RSA84_08390 [Acinetobacter sp.]
MVWWVVESFFVAEGEYLLVLRGGSLKMISRVLSTHPVYPGDILTPVRDARYIINANKQQMLKAIEATAFTEKEWYMLSLQ